MSFLWKFQNMIISDWRVCSILKTLPGCRVSRHNDKLNHIIIYREIFQRGTGFSVTQLTSVAVLDFSNTGQAYKASKDRKEDGDYIEKGDNKENKKLAKVV